MQQFHEGCSMLVDVNNIGTLQVTHLVFNVQGKMDPQPDALILWCVDDIPTLCTVCHLLLYKHVCQIKSGYIFPSFSDGGKVSLFQFQQFS